MPPPFEVRWLLAIAAVLLPESSRAEWLREWYAECWHFGNGNRAMLRARALGALPDAWFLVRQDGGIMRRGRELWRSRTGSVVALVILLCAAAVVTGGFRRARNLMVGGDSADLVVVMQRNPFMGRRERIPAALAEAWLRASRTIAEGGKWATENEVCWADARARILLRDAFAKPPCDFVEPAASAEFQFVGVVARLKNGVSMREAERELARTARLHKGWLSPSVISFDEARREPLAPVGFILAGFLIASMRYVRAWRWASVKVSLTFLLIAGVSVELIACAPFTDTGGIPAGWSAVVYLFPIVAGGLATWGLRLDARRRCAICYRALRMPVAVGESARTVFEPGGVEYLCGAGHGMFFERGYI